MPAWLIRLRLRLRATLSRTADQDLRDEQALHLDMLEQAYRDDGMTAEDARARARREFGSTMRLQEASHDLFAFRSLEDLTDDIRYAVRQIRRSAGFAIVAVLSLALGIGGVTTAFRVIDAFLLRSLPVAAPERLVALSVTNNAAWSRWPYPYFERWRKDSLLPMALTATYGLNPIDLPARDTSAGEPQQVRVSLVAGDYFATLGVRVPYGRALGPSDDRVPGGHPVAVISDGFWDRWAGRTADAIGRTIEIRGVAYEVIGVAQPGFAGDWIAQPTDVWVPLAMQPALDPAARDFFLDERDGGGRVLRLIGRLHDGATVSAARARANLVFQQLVSEKASAIGGQSPAVQRERKQHIDLLSAATGYAPERDRYLRPVVTLSVIVVLVLVVACANFANLLLARSQARQRELVVRLTLGAGRWRIVRQALAECALLALMAGVLGLLVANWATTVTLTRFAAMIQPVEIDVRFDARVLAFAGGCVLLVMLFGLLPAIWGSRRPITLAGLQRSAFPVRRWRHAVDAGRILLVAQLALCTVLMIGAALLLRTVVNLRTEDLGFDRRVRLVGVSPRQAGYTPSAAALMLRDARQRLLSLHGVQAVSMSSVHVLDPAQYWIDGSERLRLEDGQAPAGIRWTFAAVGARFFETMGTPLVRGREFAEEDGGPGSDAVVINQTLARFLFGDDNPVGRRIGMSLEGANLLIVGVVNDAKQTSPRERGLGVLYLPLRAVANPVTLAIRTSGDPAEAADMIAHHLNSIDKDLSALTIRTVADVFDQAISQERLMSAVSVSLGVLAVLIACVGLHAVMSYEVAQRTHEMGVRLALGATKATVAAIVIRDSSVLALIALAIGVPLGIAASQPLSSQLFGIAVNDPPTLVAVVLILLAVTAAATLRPARTAAQTDPLALLRAD